MNETERTKNLVFFFNVYNGSLALDIPSVKTLYILALFGSVCAQKLTKHQTATIFRRKKINN